MHHRLLRLLPLGGSALCLAAVLGPASPVSLAAAAASPATAPRSAGVAGSAARPAPAAVTTSGSAAFGSAAATVTGSAAASGPGAGAQVLLVNGDRLAVTAGGQDVAVTRAVTKGLGAGLMGLRLGGLSYEIPTAALPYLGRGLDRSLFDVAQLAAKETGGRLAVQVGYGAQLHALPGVRITRSGGGRATGYLTASSAKAFGAALVRQYLADHASGRYGSDGMFAGGESVSLAGAATVPAARPQLPMHTLAVTGTTLAGQPDTGDTIFVVNVDNTTLFGDPFEWGSHFYHGVAKFSVPAGNYDAIAGFLDPSGAFRVVDLPQFTVAGDTTVAAAEAAATNQVTFRTPRPASLQDANVFLNRIPTTGPSFDAFADNGNSPLWINETTSPPATGSLVVTAHAVLTSPAGASPPYQYALSHESTSGLILAQQYVESPASLATVHARFYQSGTSAGALVAAPGYPFEGVTVLVFDPVRLPGKLIVYASGDPAAELFQEYWQDKSLLAGGQLDADRSFTAGQQVTEQWGAAPLHAGVNVNHIGPPELTLPSASRAGDTLTLDVTPFSDSVPGHEGSGFSTGLFGPTGTVTGTYEIDQNGRKIAGGNAAQAAAEASDLLRQARLSASPSVVRFALTASRTGKAYGLATSSTTVWTWRSAPAPGDVLPAGWTCGSSAGAAAPRCTVQPMMTLGYAVQGLSLAGWVRPGPQVLRITAGHLQLASAAAITGATVQVSVNGGTTWRAVPVARTGPGQFTAAFTDSSPGVVSLRVSASDAAGGRIRETLLHAYQVS